MRIFLLFFTFLFSQSIFAADSSSEHFGAGVAHLDYVFWGAYFGMILGLISYCAFTFIRVKEVSNRWMFASFFTTIFSLVVGYQPLAELHGDSIHNLRFLYMPASALAGIFAIQFTRMFLNYKDKFPAHNVVISFAMTVVGLLSVLDMIAPAGWTILSLKWSYAVLMGVNLFMTFESWRANHQNAGWILFSWASLLSFQFLVGANQYYPFFEAGNKGWYLALGYLVHFTTFAIALKYRINELKDELFQQMKENELVLESRVKERTDQVIQTEKLASLGLMAGGVAHELNNPLMIIQGNAQKLIRMIEEAQFDDEKLRKRMHHSVDKVINGCERISDIVDSFMAFSQEDLDRGSDANDVIQVKTLIEEAVTLCRRRCHDERVDIRLWPVEASYLVQGSHQGLLQVVISVINNAREAVRGFEAEERWIRVRVVNEPDMYVLTFIDSGPTPNDEVRAKMFDPFYSSKKFGEGIGLSLSSARGIIESHGGKIVCDPAARSTTFRIYLPKLKDDSLKNVA